MLTKGKTYLSTLVRMGSKRQGDYLDEEMLLCMKIDRYRVMARGDEFCQETY